MARAFIGIGALGFVWLVFWLLIMATESTASLQGGARLHSQRSASVVRKIKWLLCFRFGKPGRSSGKFLTDPVWWFYLSGAGVFTEQARPLADRDWSSDRGDLFNVRCGSVAAGWMSSG